MDLRRHPWNQEFSWADHLPRSGILDGTQADQFDTDGFVVIPDLVGGAELDEAVEEIDRLESDTEAWLRTQPDERLAIAEAGAITFTTHLVARSAILRRLSAHPNIVGLCRDLIGPDVRLYWDQAVYKKPEKPRRFPWHQDNGYTFVEPQAYLTVWLALTDATVDNGCPQVARGLHRVGTLEHRYVDPLGFECFQSCDDVAVAEVPTGGAAVFSSLTPHLTGPNLTGVVRKAYILQYAPTGARRLLGDARSGPPTGAELCDAADRQYEVLRGGAAVAPPPLAPAAGI